MATPIRMAPILFGKDAEYFYETWQKSLKIPDPNAPTKEDLEKYKKLIARSKKLGYV